MRNLFLFLLMSFFSLSVAAQRTSFFVAPQATDPQIDRNLQSHYLAINPGATG